MGKHSKIHLNIPLQSNINSTSLDGRISTIFNSCGLVIQGVKTTLKISISSLKNAKKGPKKDAKNVEKSQKTKTYKFEIRHCKIAKK